MCGGYSCAVRKIILFGPRPGYTLSGAPAELFQSGSKVMSAVQGGSKSKNFALWVGQIPNFFRLYGQVRKFAEPVEGSSDPV